MRYYLIAGEASGDLHGSNLVKGLRAEDPAAEIRCRGGDLMQAAGAELAYHYKEGAVMGLSDVLGSAGKLLRNLRDCKRDIAAWRPDVVILIDYPGFNMRIAKWCHARGIRVFYYIAPKTWASREGRNRRLKKWVDRLFIVFPFEIQYFTEKGVPFVYAGNPLLDAVDSHAFVRPAEGRYIAVLAGSRKGEIARTMPVCMAAADLVICRAGAITLSEIQAMGKPAILIPSPNVAENHQFHNAMALVNHQAGELIEEKDLTGELLTQKIDKIVSDPERLAQYSENAHKMAIIDANERIYNIIMDVYKQHREE